MDVTFDRHTLKTLGQLETPAVVVDSDVLKRNIERAAKIARSAGVALRPHAKTHKSLTIAQLQLNSGAVGITVAKTSEAMVFLRGGIRDITIAHPLIDPNKIERITAAAQLSGSRLRLIVDSHAGLSAISAATKSPVEVLIKIDVGLKRCGVDPESSAAIELARAIHTNSSLGFAGIISHAGHSYRATGPDAVRVIAEAERATMTAVSSRILATGIPVPCVSVGSTPTIWLAESFKGITEIRPGNSVFMDLSQVSLGVADRSDLALSVIASVVSVNSRYAIIDAGSKVLSSDRGPHGSTRLSGYGIAQRLAVGMDEMPVVALSEEHGFVEHQGRAITIGERLRILPNHACTVVNLARSVVAFDSAGKTVDWPIEAHGCVY